MENVASKLIEVYKEYVSSNVEYNMVRWHIKEMFYNYETKEEVRKGIGYYDVFIKNKDHSYYTNDAIDYLKDKKLDKFIGYKVDFKKVKLYIPEDVYLENLISEKTILSFRSQQLIDDIKIIKELARDRYKQLVNQRARKDVINLKLVERCEVLKLKTKNLKYEFNKLCYEMKKLILNSGKGEECVLGIDFKINIIGATFKADFEKQLLGTDFSTPYVITDKLKKSTSKKIDWDYLEKFKVEDIRPYLYIKVFLSRLQSYNKKKDLK